jgi:glucokinase
MIIGVDCGATFIKAGLIDKSRILRKVQVATEAEKGKSVSMKNLMSAIKKIFSSKVQAIGIGFPAPVDSKKGIIYATNNMPGWKNVNLKKIIERHFRVPCHINNDARCFALAESTYGSGKGKKNIVGITLGTGVGMGIIIDSKLYSGHTGAAGEISKVPYHGQNIEKLANLHFFKTVAHMEPQEMLIKLKKHDISSQKLMNQYGKNLGILITVIVNIMDPELIILGGGLASMFPYFKKALYAEIKKHCFEQVYKNMRIIQSTLDNAAVLGAASLCECYG